MAAPSLSEWIGTTPWGTTPLGLASRLACPAAATWVAVAGSPGSVGSNVTLVIIAAILFALSYVLPWVFERFTQESASITLRTDRALVYPSVAATIVAIILVLTAFLPAATIAIAVAQTAWVSTAFIRRKASPADTTE